MKKIGALVLFFCAMAFCLAALPASAALPKNHKEYMKDEDYKNSFEQFAAGMKEAKERLTPDEYKALENVTGEAIAASVKEDAESGCSEAEAYETAFYVGGGYIENELRWDWLRKNAEDAQGFYRLKSGGFEGYMTLEKGDDEGEYAVNISVVMKQEPYNSGEFYGPGRLSGGGMAVYDSDDTNVITITFDGGTAKLASSREFKESGELGEGVSIDGEYLREKK